MLSSTEVSIYRSSNKACPPLFFFLLQIQKKKFAPIFRILQLGPIRISTSRLKFELARCVTAFILLYFTRFEVGNKLLSDYTNLWIKNQLKKINQNYQIDEIFVNLEMKFWGSWMVSCVDSASRETGWLENCQRTLIQIS